MEQQNQYIKQFPELYRDATVLYVHGFGSSGQSGTVARLRQVLPGARVVAPDLPVHPAEAMELLQRVCSEEQPALVIGTSMGGMYAEMLRGYDRILVNPALRMGETMKEHGMTGTQHFQNPRQDGQQEFIVTKALVKEYREMTDHCFETMDDDDRRRVWGLFGDADTTVDTYDLFSEHYPQAIRFHGEHRMNDRSFMHSVVPVMRWADDRRQGRERPVVYIAVTTLRDDYGRARSSAQKAVRRLLENYQLYFVAPAGADAAGYADTVAWLYEWVNVPAYGHTVFTNRKDLLYGDYIIDIVDDDADGADGMATLISFGSDTFKTWDDVTEYFERLGGQ